MKTLVPRLQRMLLMLLLLCALPGCSRDSAPAKPAAPLQSVSICLGGILAPLPIIAKEKELFAAEGLAVSLNTFGDGKASMQAFLEGKCDAAITGDPPVVKHSFEREDFVIIAAVTSTDNANKILARRDRGIAVPSDLAGKRVAVASGTAPHFFFDQFLMKHRLDPAKITVVAMPLKEMPEALQRGDLDAIAVTDVMYQKGVQAIGPKGVSFAEPGLVHHSSSLLVKRAWLATHQGTARGVLQALLLAEKELATRPEDSARLVAKVMNMPESAVKGILAGQHNQVTLDQIMLLSFEDHARWMLETGAVKGKTVPNYLRLFDPTLLRELSPAAVQLK